MLYSPDWKNTGFSFTLLTVNPFRHSTLTEHGLYNPFLVYCRELAHGTVSLTGDWAQGDDSKYDLHFFFYTDSYRIIDF